MIESDDTITKLMYDLGANLVYDDRDDLGYFSYRGRRNHRYHGQTHPDHPSNFHHWQLGVLMMLLAEGITLGNLVKDAKEAIAEDDLS